MQKVSLLATGAGAIYLWLYVLHFGLRMHKIVHYSNDLMQFRGHGHLRLIIPTWSIAQEHVQLLHRLHLIHRRTYPANVWLAAVNKRTVWGNCLVSYI